MKLVVDTNIVVSSLIKDSLSRELLSHSELELYAPDYLLEEIQKYREELLEKSGLRTEAFEELLGGLKKFVKFLPQDSYEKYLELASKELPDSKDAPFLALAISLDCGIWSQDAHFKQQRRVPAYTTKELAEKLNSLTQEK